MKKNRTKKEWVYLIVKYAIILAVLAVTVVVTIKAMPWVISLKDEANREAFKAYIYSKGWQGVLIMLLIQIVQVVIAIIPGEPIEIVSGALYGTWGGWLLCTIGLLIGSIIIYYAVKIFGARIIKNLEKSGKFDKFKFLQDTKRLEVIAFLLFFIPGTPKDVLTYFMPLTKIKAVHFFLITAIARIPSVISSTFAGASLSDGQWLQFIVIFLITGVVGIAGILVNNKLLDRWNKRKQKKAADGEHDGDK